MKVNLRCLPQRIIVLILNVILERYDLLFGLLFRVIRVELYMRMRMIKSKLTEYFEDSSDQLLNGFLLLCQLHARAQNIDPIRGVLGGHGSLGNQIVLKIGSHLVLWPTIVGAVSSRGLQLPHRRPCRVLLLDDLGACEIVRLNICI